MYNVNVYNAKGIKTDQLSINDDIQFVDGRVSKGKTHYYKGVGLPYKSHFTKQYNHQEYDLVEDTDIFYLGSEVSKKCFQNKFGIFQEKYQPQFEDYIGSCGVKELDIIGNSIDFERSSVNIIKSHLYDKVNQQYYFELDYKCKRIGYIQSGRVKSLYELLEYMMVENWNFIWDKNTITDISYNGLVTDVGDIFQSSQLSAKLGTIYSVLYSLAHNDKKKFGFFIKYGKLQYKTPMDFVMNSLKLMQRFGIDISEIERNSNKETYINAVSNYLVTGKNCGDCSFVDLGNQIREQYKQNVKTQLSL